MKNPFGHKINLGALFREDDRLQRETNRFIAKLELDRKQRREQQRRAPPAIHTATAAPAAPPAPTEVMPETYLSLDQIKTCHDLGLDEARLRRMHPMSRELFLTLRKDKHRLTVLKSAVGEHLPEEEHEQFFEWYRINKAVQRPGGLQYRTRINNREKS
jgi:hypothetical protein